MRVIKKEIPIAMAVQSTGTSTRRMGSLKELQLTVLMAELGMSHKRAKLAILAVPDTTLKALKIRQAMRGIRAGRATISIKPLNHREKPNPAGSTMASMKN